MEKLAAVAGTCGALICYAIIIFFKGAHAEIPFVETVLFALLGSAIGFLACFYPARWALGVVRRAGARIAFILGPAVGAACGAWCGAVSSVLIGPQFAQVAGWCGAALGSAMGLALGFILGVPLALLESRYRITHAHGTKTS